MGWGLQQRPPCWADALRWDWTEKSMAPSQAVSTCGREGMAWNAGTPEGSAMASGQGDAVQLLSAQGGPWRERCPRCFSATQCRSVLRKNRGAYGARGQTARVKKQPVLRV
jgi:hypothetical protein